MPLNYYRKDAMRDDKDELAEKMRLLKEWCDLQINRRGTPLPTLPSDPAFQRFMAKVLHG